MRGKTIFLVLLVLVAFTLAAAPGDRPRPVPAGTQQINMQIPPGWTVYRGQNGLVVPHPSGWNVQERGDGGFAAFCPNQEGRAVALVYVQPILKIEGRSAGVVQGLGQIAPDLFPNVRVAGVRVVSSKPEVAVGELAFTPRATKFVGTAMCFKEDPQGVIYAIASTEAVWPQGEAVMKQVLGRFFYSGRGGEAAGDGAAGVSAPAMVMWRDPVEGAFTCPVPQGWKVQGGLRRFSLGDNRPEVVATSPDGKISIRFGDAAVPAQMSLPTQMGAMAGFYEGGSEKDEFGTTKPILRYLPSTAYLTQIYIPQRVGQVSHVEAENQPQQVIQDQYGLTHYVDAGGLTFDVQAETGSLKGGVLVKTRLSPYQGVEGGNWAIDLLLGYQAVPGSETTAVATVVRMAEGFKWDPGWDARQVQALTQVHGKVMQVQRQTADIINRTYANRSASQDRISENWGRANRGEVLIQDPTTGERFEVPSGSNYYFRVGSDNTFIGTDTAAPPDMPNHWLKEMRIGN